MGSAKNDKVSLHITNLPRRICFSLSLTLFEKKVQSLKKKANYMIYIIDSGQRPKKKRVVDKHKRTKRD